jgi:2-polyprenyl-6-methoxyphenol hydroxylase-like FAD-dependent oxidoreductase
MSAYDAIVIGGGPAGATAALALARRGWRVAAIEKSRFPRRKVCGEHVSAGAWPVLDALGVGASLASLAGPPVRRVGLFAAETMLDVPMPSNGAEWGRAVGRELLDTVLLEHAARAGAEVLQPWSAVSVAAGPREATVVARCGDEERELVGRVVVAAHGSWEHGPLPTQSARDARRAGDLLAFKARFVGARLAPGLMPLVLFPGGYGGLVQSDAGRVTFSCCVRRQWLARLRAEHPGAPAGEAALAHAMESSRGLREALAGAWREGPWLAAGPIRPGIRVHVPGRLFAVGNAAGEAHPFVAEGIGMAIQSGWLLAQALGDPAEAAERAALDAAAREYERRWRAHFAARVRVSSLFAAVTGRALHASIALVAAAPEVLAWGARWSGKASGVALAERA